MDREYWLRQLPDKPLFPELAWSRPENRQQAGKLLIIGGNLYGFAAPGEAYAAAAKAGVGTAKVLLPVALQKIVGTVLENAEFAPSTPSGSFGQKALNEFLTYGNWADGILIAGDLGRNSETAILLEKFLAKSPGLITLTKDAADYVVSAPHIALARPNTALVLSLSQLQRLATTAKTDKAITFSMDLLHLAEWLHDFTAQHAAGIVVKHLNQLLVAFDGQVNSTTLQTDIPVWRLKFAAHGAVWWLQNPGQVFKAWSAAVATLAK